MNDLKTLKLQFKSGTAVHAYVVEQEKSLVRNTLRECAKIAMCSVGGCGTCETCKKIDASSHADCIFLPLDDRAKLKVEDVAYLVEESMKRPVDSGESRVFLIDATESVSGANSAAWQNKLLKTLEEPLPGIFIFIGVENAESLYPTILSRSQVLPKQTETARSVLGSILDVGFKRSACEFAALMSGGSRQKAEKILMDMSYFTALEVAERMLVSMTSTKNAVFFVADVCSRKEIWDKYLQVLSALLMESLQYRLAPQLCLLTSYESDIIEICKNYSLQAAEVCIELISAAQKRIDAGGNFTVEMDKLAIDMLEVKYRCRI